MQKGEVFDYQAKLKYKHLAGSINICDETLRDGEQTPGVALSLDQKIDIAKALDDIGVYSIDSGYPASSIAEKQAIKALVNENLRTNVTGIARTLRNDLDACRECSLDRVLMFVGTSELHLKYKMNKSKDEVLKMVETSTSYGLDHGMKITFVAEDASRSDPEFLIECYKEALLCGADSIIITDTVGSLTPDTTKLFISNIRDKLSTYKKMKMWVHFHNDLGLATANTLAAIQEGATHAQVCVNGYGERAGNASFEEIVYGAEKLLNIKTGIKLEKIMPLSKLVEKHFMIPVNRQKPIIGSHVFSHESGIHVQGVLKNPQTYEVVEPEAIRRRRKFIIGKHSGVHAIKLKLSLLGIAGVTDIQAETILKKVKESIFMLKENSLQKFNRIKVLESGLNIGVTDDRFKKIVESVLMPKKMSWLQKLLKN